MAMAMAILGAFAPGKELVVKVNMQMSAGRDAGTKRKTFGKRQSG